MSKFKKSGCFENCKVLSIWNRLFYWNRAILGDFISIFAKKTKWFLLLFVVPKKTIKNVTFSCENNNKIAKNRPILMKFTVPNRQEFAIFKTLRFFEFGQYLMAEGRDWALFCRPLSPSQGFKKMDFRIFWQVVI